MDREEFKESLLENAYWKKSESGCHVAIGWDSEADPRCEQVSVCLWDNSPSQANNAALNVLKDDFIGKVDLGKLTPMMWEEPSMEEGVCQLSLILNSDHRPEIAPESAQRDEGRRRIANVVECIEGAFDQTVAERVGKLPAQSAAPQNHWSDRAGRPGSSPVR